MSSFPSHLIHWIPSLSITHISQYLQVGTYSVLTSRYLPLASHHNISSWHQIVNHVAVSCYRRILPCSAPMKAMSGVLESSIHSLSIRRIISLVGAEFENRLGQKQGYKASGGGRIQAASIQNIFTSRSKNEY